MIRALAVLLLFASPAVAELSAQWSHASAPGGQFEGGYTGKGGEFINYSCTSFSAQLSIGANGMHVAKGSATLKIDGATLYEGQINYYNVSDISQVDFGLDSNSHDYEKDIYQRVASAIANGREAVLITPTGEQFSYSLEGSKGIRSCL